MTRQAKTGDPANEDRPNPVGGDANTPPPVKLFGLLSGMWQARAIYLAAQLRIADVLAEGPRTTPQLAELTGTQTQPLYRLLRAVARLGVFAELDEGHFANTELSQFLRPGVPGSMYAMAMGCADWGWRAWGELEHSVRTGQPAFDKVHGIPLFEYFAEKDAAAGALFDESMTGFSASVDLPIARAADLTGT